MFAFYLTVGFVSGVVITAEGISSSFIQTGEALHYYVDHNNWNDAVFAQVFLENANKGPEEKIPKEGRKATLLAQLKFEPPFLEFNTRAIGMPELRKVKVSNSGQASVRFEAISGSTVHFHCSFFEHKTVEAGESTTFDVVFLPRQEGVIDNTLLVHSSAGNFHYRVSGKGAPNPYRLRPFVGARIPLNGSFVQSVDIYNPHSTTLKVTEIFSSGGDLHLQLPDQSRDGPESVWEIPPFRTRTLMKARFIGSRERNATAYIRIKTDRPEKPALLVPVEVEVMSKPGLYAANHLDFGTVSQRDHSKWLTLNVYNTLNRTVQITGIEVDVEAIKVNFTPIMLVPNSRTPSVVAKLAYFGIEEQNFGSSWRNGVVKVKSEDPAYTLDVPYNVRVMTGKIYHNEDDITFHCCPAEKNSTTMLSHSLNLWSSFGEPLSIFNVSIPRAFRIYFNVSSFDYPVILPTMGNVSVCTVDLLIEKFYDNLRSLNAFIRLYTNISEFDVPLRIFDGKLRYTLYSIDQTNFDFGSLDVGQERYILFAVTNENPVTVTLRRLGVEGSNLPVNTHLELVGVEAGNHTVLAYNHSPMLFSWNQGEDVSLFPNSFAVFRYLVKAPDNKSTYRGHVNFTTEYESVVIPVYFTVTEGSVISVPEKIFINDAFPGKISSHALRVYSTYPKEMVVLRLSTISSDTRFVFESFEKDQGPLIKVKEASQIGRIYFVPLAACMYDCYVGMPLNTEDGYHWIRGMKLPPDLPDIDFDLYRKLRSRWNKIVSNNEHTVNTTVMVDSTLVKSFPMPVEARLCWPRLMKNAAVHFPLTAVGNYTIVNLTLQNPSSLPVAVQMLPLTIYPNPEDLVRLFKDELEEAPLTDYVEMDDVLMFSLRDSELYNARRESPVPMFRQALEQALNTQIPRFTLSLLLQPGMKVRIRLGFLPSDFDLRSSLLLIRNNLTVLEMVTLYGRGAKMELRLSNRPPNSAQPLMFEIQDKHLTECENIKRLQHKLPTSLTLRRSFLAKNTGELPMTVTNLTLNGVNCQNRGFRVLNCEPFTLQPNDTYEIEIAFTPDFTLSWYEASLQLYLAGMHMPMMYSLGATIPRDWLPKCQAALPRPYWESLMYYSCVIALAFLFVCVIASAYLEGDRIITCALRRYYDVRFRSFFDLNACVEERTKTLESDVKQIAQNSSQSGNDSAHPPLWRRMCQLIVSLIKERKLTRTKNENFDDRCEIDDVSNHADHKTYVDSPNAVADRKSNAKNRTATAPPLTNSGPIGFNKRKQSATTFSSAVGAADARKSQPDAKFREENQQPMNKQQNHVTTGKKQKAATKLSRRHVTLQKSNELESEMDENAVGVATSHILDATHNKQTVQNYEQKTSGPEVGTLPIVEIVHFRPTSALLSKTLLADQSAKSAFSSVKAKRRLETRKKQENRPTKAPFFSTAPENQPRGEPQQASNPVGSESDDHAIPEWDSTSLPASDSQNIDEAFDQLSYQTEKFSNDLDEKDAVFNDLISPDDQIYGVPPVLSTVPPPKPSSTLLSTEDDEDGANGDDDDDDQCIAMRNWSSLSSLEHSDSSTSPAPNRQKSAVLKPSVIGQRLGAHGTVHGTVHTVQPNRKSPAKEKPQKTNERTPVLLKKSIAAVPSKILQLAVGSGYGSEPSRRDGSKKQHDPTKNEVKSTAGRTAMNKLKNARPKTHAPSTAVLPSADPRNTAKTAKIPPAIGAGSSLIQQLRQERLRRFQEYNSQKQNEGWPGFDLSPVVPSLWDDDYEPATLSCDKSEWPSAGFAPWSDRVWSATFGAADPPLHLDADVAADGATWPPAPTSSTHAAGVGRGVAGWSPNNSSPFGFDRYVQEAHRCSATAFGVTSTPPPPPNDSSILAWGPLVAGSQEMCDK